MGGVIGGKIGLTGGLGVGVGTTGRTGTGCTIGGEGGEGGEGIGPTEGHEGSSYSEGGQVPDEAPGIALLALGFAVKVPPSGLVVQAPVSVQ